MHCNTGNTASTIKSLLETANSSKFCGGEPAAQYVEKQKRE